MADTDGGGDADDAAGDSHPAHLTEDHAAYLGAVGAELGGLTVPTAKEILAG